MILLDEVYCSAIEQGFAIPSPPSRQGKESRERTVVPGGARPVMAGMSRPLVACSSGSSMDGGGPAEEGPLVLQALCECGVGGLWLRCSDGHELRSFLTPGGDLGLDKLLYKLIRTQRCTKVAATITRDLHTGPLEHLDSSCVPGGLDQEE